MRYNQPLQLTRGACRYRTSRAKRIGLRWSRVMMLAHEYFGRRSRLALQLRLNEEEPLAAELYVTRHVSIGEPKNRKT